MQRAISGSFKGKFSSGKEHDNLYRTKSDNSSASNGSQDTNVIDSENVAQLQVPSQGPSRERSKSWDKSIKPSIGAGKFRPGSSTDKKLSVPDNAKMLSLTSPSFCVHCVCLKEYRQLLDFANELEQGAGCMEQITPGGSAAKSCSRTNVQPVIVVSGVDQDEWRTSASDEEYHSENENKLLDSCVENREAITKIRTDSSSSHSSSSDGESILLPAITKPVLPEIKMQLNLVTNIDLPWRDRWLSHRESDTTLAPSDTETLETLTPPMSSRPSLSLDARGSGIRSAQSASASPNLLSPHQTGGGGAKFRASSVDLATLKHDIERLSVESDDDIRNRSKSWDFSPTQEHKKFQPVSRLPTWLRLV